MTVASSGVMSMGISNEEGEMVWSQSYYLNALVDLVRLCCLYPEQAVFSVPNRVVCKFSVGAGFCGFPVDHRHLCHGLQEICGLACRVPPRVARQSDFRTTRD